MDKHKSIRSFLFLAVFMLGMALFLHPQAANASSFDWPDETLVLVPDIPLVHTDSGLKLIESAAFIDGQSRLQVPLRFIAEEMGASVSYTEPRVMISLNGCEITLEINSNQAIVDGKMVQMDTAPLLRSGRTFVPLRFIADYLDLITLYQDGVVLVGSEWTRLSVDDILALRQRILSRWVEVRPDWTVVEASLEPTEMVTDPFLYFWRDLGDFNYGLYQSLRSNPAMAFVIADSFQLDDWYAEGAPYGGLHIRPDGCYMLLHTGGASIGSEHLYRFSGDHGAEHLASGRMAHLTFSGDYVYFISVGIGAPPGLIYRLHIPTALAEKNVPPQFVADIGAFTGYRIEGDEIVYWNGLDEEGNRITGSISIRSADPVSLAGYITIVGDTLYLDEAEVLMLSDEETLPLSLIQSLPIAVSINDEKRVADLGLTERDFPNWYYVHPLDQETAAFALTDETVYSFTDANLLFVKEADGDRLYTTTQKEEYLQHLSSYFDPPSLPYVVFVTVQGNNVISVTEVFLFTV